MTSRIQKLARVFNYRRSFAGAASLWLLFGVQAVHSADIAYEVRQGSDATLSLELGIQLYATKIPIVGYTSEDPDDPIADEIGATLLIAGRAEWQGLFLELVAESFTVGALGYKLWEGDRTTFDLILTDGGIGGFDPGIGSFESVEERGSDAVIGLRSSHKFDSTLAQLELYSDVSGKHDGQIAALQLGRFKQIRNWNIHGVVGLRYFSDKMADYYFGISEEESTASIPRYQASGGMLSRLEIGATIPLSEHWIFKSTVEGYYFPDSFSDSPLTNDRLGSFSSASFSYVF